MDTPTSANQTNSTATAPDVSGVVSGVNAALTGADAVVRSGIDTLQQVHQARLSRLNRDLAALKASYGADDPRVQAAQAAVQAGMATVARISLLRTQAAGPSVQVPAGGWVLHGQVLASDLTPQQGFTVFLVDDKKAFLRQYGFAYTDATGSFEIRFAPATAQQAAAAAQIFIEVADAKANPVYLSTDPFQPVIGAAAIVNIVLPAGGKPIGDPPPEIRNIAMPQPGKPADAGSGADKK